MRLVPVLTLVVFATVLGTGCTPSSASEPGTRSDARPAAPVAAEPAGQAFGQPLSDRPVVAMADLLARPEQFEGQTVRLSGTIRAVCQHRGCWMDLGPGAEADGRVHVRSLDHALAFPRDAVGKTAEVEGEVQAMPGASSCGGHEDDQTPGCGVAAAGRRVQLAVRGAVLR